jgi:hypothetical protein
MNSHAAPVSGETMSAWTPWTYDRPYIDGESLIPEHVDEHEPLPMPPPMDAQPYPNERMIKLADGVFVSQIQFLRLYAARMERRWW